MCVWERVSHGSIVFFVCVCVSVCRVCLCGSFVRLSCFGVGARNRFFCMFGSFRQVHLFVCFPASLSAMAWHRDLQRDLDVALQKFADSVRALARALQAGGRLDNGQLRAIADLIRLLLRWIWRDSRADTLIRGYAAQALQRVEDSFHCD